MFLLEQTLTAVLWLLLLNNGISQSMSDVDKHVYLQDRYILMPGFNLPILDFQKILTFLVKLHQLHMHKIFAKNKAFWNKVLG